MKSYYVQDLVDKYDTILVNPFCSGSEVYTVQYYMQDGVVDKTQRAVLHCIGKTDGLYVKSISTDIDDILIIPNLGKAYNIAGLESYCVANTKFKTLFIPNSLSLRVGSRAFYGSDNLKTVICPTRHITYGENAFPELMNRRI